MKISEYTLLEDAFHNSFGFMLNRLADLDFLKGDPHDPANQNLKDLAEDRCFSEFMVALEEMGITLEEAQVTKVRDEIYK